MRTLQIALPEFVQVGTLEIMMILAGKLYESGKLSLGQAAELAGISKRTFIETIGNYGFSIFNYDPEDLESDVRNA